MFVERHINYSSTSPIQKTTTANNVVHHMFNSIKLSLFNIAKYPKFKILSQNLTSMFNVMSACGSKVNTIARVVKSVVCADVSERREGGREETLSLPGSPEV